MKNEPKGGRALLIGGSCEIAITLARRMIETSIHPILTYRNEAGRDRIHKSMPSFSGKYESRRLVLGDIESLDALFEDIKGNLDFLVDFANGDYESLIASADDETVSRYFEENISFRAHILKRAGRTMLIKKRGRLVYVSSTAAASPNPGQGFYSAAKSASEALYRNMGLELGKRGITAVVVRPGYVDAGRGAVYLAERGGSVLEKIPTGRAIGKDEIAGVILFLLSEDATGINGTVITVDGGLTSGK